MGVRKGLVAQLRDDGIPWLIGVHCFNHRLELAVKNAFANTYMNDVIDTLMSVYYLYEKSPKRLHHLRSIAEIMEKKVKKPLRCHGTRWVQHKLQACQALVKSYPVLVTHLESMATDPQQDMAKAKGILKKLLATKFVLHVLYFVQLLEPVMRVSLSWQSDTVDMPKAMSSLRHLQQLFSEVTEETPVDNSGSKKDSVALANASPELKKLLSDCDAYVLHQPPADKPNEKPKEVTFHSFALKEVKLGVTYFRNHCTEYVGSLERCVADRFADLDEGMMASAKLLDTRLWPVGDPSFSTSFGNDKVEAAAAHFSALLALHMSSDGNKVNPVDELSSTAGEMVAAGSDHDVMGMPDASDSEDSLSGMEVTETTDVLLSGLMTEWGEFKCLVAKDMNHLVANPVDLWIRLHTMYHVNFPRLNHLILVLRTIPMSNGIVERCFSTMNKTKTDWRCSLGADSLEALIRIKKEGPSLANFNAAEAVKIFFSSPRRPDGRKVEGAADGQ